MSCLKIALRDSATGELHRADVLVGRGTPRATVLELQHSSISEDERIARETFYRREHRMFWLVHIHSESLFLGTYFSMSLDFSSRVTILDDKQFAFMRWMEPSKQFIEKWKRATAHVFFSAGPHIFYLASPGVAARLGAPLRRGEFALCALSRDDFLRAVRWNDAPLPNASLALKFQQLLKSHNIACSMSRRGDCCDNAAMESFFSTWQDLPNQGTGQNRCLQLHRAFLHPVQKTLKV